MEPLDAVEAIQPGGLLAIEGEPMDAFIMSVPLLLGDDTSINDTSVNSGVDAGGGKDVDSKLLTLYSVLESEALDILVMNVSLLLLKDDDDVVAGEVIVFGADAGPSEDMGFDLLALDLAKNGLQIRSSELTHC